MLSEEVEYWWENTRQRMETANAKSTWANFTTEFLEKYFPTDVCSLKEIEFLHMKQGSMSVADYADKFEDLSRFYPFYNGVEAEVSKWLNFESGLRHEIKWFIGYQEIYHLSVLVNKCRIYDEDSKAKFSHYKSLSEKKNGNPNYGKLYVTPVDDGK